MPFEPIRKILPSFVVQRGIAPQLKVRRVLEVAVEVLKAHWGEEKAALVRPVSFSEGRLKLESTSAAAVQELKVHEVQLMNEINRRLGDRAVKQMLVMSKGF